jgi:type II secretory pathway pseudopilin PulG
MSLSKLLQDQVNQKGQGIIEIVVVLALAAILILALVALSVRSNRSANFSSAEDQASRLAQEGMEIIRGAKNSNSQTILLGSGCTGASSSRMGWEAFFDENVEDNCDYTADGFRSIYGRIGHGHLVGLDPTCPTTDPNPYPCINFDDGVSGVESSTNDGTQIGNRNFQRAYFVADTPTAAGGVSICNTNGDPDPLIGDWDDIKQFTVIVYWDDTSGRHETINTTCLRRL